MSEAESDRPQLTSKTPDTDDPNRLTRSSTITEQRRVHGQPGAEHRRGVLRLDCLGDGEHPAVVDSDRGGVASLCEDSVGWEDQRGSDSDSTWSA
jgi:hypothetical protein